MNELILTEAEIRTELFVAAPPGLDWTLWTDRERIKYKTIALAQSRKILDEFDRSKKEWLSKGLPVWSTLWDSAVERLRKEVNDAKV